MPTPQQVKTTLGIEQELQCDKYKLDNSWVDFEQQKIEQYNSEPGNKKDYDCPKCKNKGYIAFLSESNTMALYPCNCAVIRNSVKAAKQSGAWDLMQRCKLENFKVETDWQKNMKILASEYCKQKEKGWFFAGGQTGAGKTHLCTAIFRNSFNKPVKGLYMMWRDKVRKLLNAGFAGYEQTEQRIEEFKQCDVLYIDDLFKTDDTVKPERREIELAFEILNSRYNTNKTTIISSERTIKEIAILNQAIAGRIVEKCGKYLVQIDMDSSKNYRLGAI